MGNSCCNRKNSKRKIVLLLVGLDNAGKTVAAKGLAGESLEDVVPTVGFAVINLKYQNYTVKVFDLGGGSGIRGIWCHYFVNAHGIIFVVDSSDYTRLEEAKEVLQELLSHEKISGKPVLLLANKQDQQEALDELDLVEKLQLEMLVNKKECPTLVESCSATDVSNKSKLDPGIKKGYMWLLNYIVRNYQCINTRVETDVKLQEIEDKQARLEKIERLKIDKETDDDAIESYSNYKKNLSGDVVVDQQASFEDQADIYVIPDVLSDSSSNDSEEAFPHTYHGRTDELMQQERPKSAVQLVKEQLEMTVQKRPAFKSFVSNKTAPVNLYGLKQPQSAKEGREHVVDRRNLRSAGDSAFVFSNDLPNSVLPGPDGDEFHQELFQLNNFHRLQKLPPLRLVKPKVSNGIVLDREEASFNVH